MNKTIGKIQSRLGAKGSNSRLLAAAQRDCGWVRYWLKYVTLVLAYIWLFLADRYLHYTNKETVNKPL